MKTETAVAPAQPVDVVVPVLNEHEMLPEFLRRVDSLKLPLHLIFVDNGSTDGTLEFLGTRPDVTVIAHGENLGYGRSLIDGMRASTSDRVVIIDADCEYPPEAIPALLDELEQNQVVYASRFRDSHDIDMSRLRSGGNRLLTAFYNMLYRQGLTDLYTGMKGMRREAIADMPFSRTGFEHVAELAARLSRRGYQIAELPIAYRPRQTGRSKMKHFSELMKAVYVLIYYRVAPNA